MQKNSKQFTQIPRPQGDGPPPSQQARGAHGFPGAPHGGEPSGSAVENPAQAASAWGPRPASWVRIMLTGCTLDRRCWAAPYLWGPLPEPVIPVSPEKAADNSISETSYKMSRWSKARKSGETAKTWQLKYNVASWVGSLTGKVEEVWIEFGVQLMCQHWLIHYDKFFITNMPYVTSYTHNIHIHAQHVYTYTCIPCKMLVIGTRGRKHVEHSC